MHKSFWSSKCKYHKISKYFPKIKIVARGNTLKAYGEDILLQEFSIKTNMLIAHYGKYNVLNEEIIERIIFADSKEKTILNGGTEVNILHGVGGKLLRLRL